VPLTQTERDTTDQRFYAIVTDIVGTPMELVDTDGRLVWHQATTLWCEALAPSAQGAHCPLRFPGQYHDVETGQNYNLFRYYDPAAAGYASSDPLGVDGGTNPHAYLPNPVDWSDPLGLTPCSKARWKAKADFSSQKTMSKKYDAHAEDFGVKGNRNKTTLAQYEAAMRNHVTDPDTKIYRFNLPRAGAGGRLHQPEEQQDGHAAHRRQVLVGYKLDNDQFMSIVHRGFPW